jgi:FMN phosphatase YigB (HAD superfamily)
VDRKSAGSNARGKSRSKTILFDCDGVIVDNDAFERRVTKTLIGRLAVQLETTEARASAVWADELSATRGDWRWYDYAWHCQRLDIGGRAVVEEAHQDAAHLLAEVQGASETIDSLERNGYSVGIVTDATDWVVRFKLHHLGISAMRPLFASSTMQSVKTSRVYWEKLSGSIDRVPRAVVDNRIENLTLARNVYPGLQAIQFRRDEHVTRLPARLAPLRNTLEDTAAIVSVTDHEGLRTTFKSLLPNFQMTA